MDNNQAQSGTEASLVDYLIVILRDKELIIKATLSVTFLAAVVSLLTPPTYLAETRILPPQNSSASMSAAFATQMGGIGASALGIKIPNDLYIELLKTRSVADYVGDKLGLRKMYKIKPQTSMRNPLNPGLSVRDDRRSGILTIGYIHRNPQLAADIANAYVEGLQKLNNKLAVTEASKRRLFFEEQLKSAKENLINSEESLKNFQQRTGTIKIDDESKAALDTVARLRAGISAKEVELRVMKSFATVENPDMRKLQDETAALKEELLKLESKSRLGDGSVPTVAKMSALGTEYVRKMRDFRYNETLYEILMKQFEAAKLDESKDAALIQVIEAAVAPEQRLEPKRKKIVVAAFFFTLAFMIVIVLFKGHYQALMSDPGTKEKIQQTRGYLDCTQLIKDLKLDKATKKVKSLL